MSFLETVKENIGIELYSRLENEAEKEVESAIQMPLQDKWRQEQYYRPEFLLAKYFPERQRFEELGLKISPLDVINILFKCKMLFAVQSQDEYMHRIGGGMQNIGLWRDKSGRTVDTVINVHFDRLHDSLCKRTLLAEINSYKELDPNFGTKYHQEFFENLFTKLGFSFVAFFDDGHLIDKHKQAEPGLIEYGEKKAEEYFCAPSIGFATFGSEIYCREYARAWLRTFFNILRIAGFLNPGQIDFGPTNIQFLGPKASVFLGTYSQGCYCWNEDTREPWAKTPDGCIFLSFGYRGLSKMWLDKRTYPGVERIFLETKNVFECLKNPWKTKALRDVIPTFDILSSATQIPDIGAKILLFYCSLEHLFVPVDVTRDNKKYIVGGINATRSDLLPWFKRLYDLRCEYAHKGFVVRNDKNRGLIFESMENILLLLVAKLANA